MSFVWFTNENNGASSKNPLHVLVGSNMMQFKIDAKQDQWLVNDTKESFQFASFSVLIDLVMKKACKFANFHYAVTK